MIFSSHTILDSSCGLEWGFEFRAVIRASVVGVRWPASNRNLYTH